MRILILSLIFVCGLVVVGQDMKVETLLSLPEHSSKFETLSVTSMGDIWVNNRSLGPWFLSAAKPNTWQKGQLKGNGVWWPIPYPASKNLAGGTILQGVNTSLGSSVVLTSADFIPTFSQLPMFMTSVMENGFMGQPCQTQIHNMGGVQGHLSLDRFRGGFPSKDGIYYTGTREVNQTSSGIYRVLDNPSGACWFEETVLLTDPRFELASAWPEKNGTFVGERFLKNPSTVETEIVRIAPTGEATVLVSSTDPKSKIKSSVCCNLVFDPDTRKGVGSYRDKDGIFHFVSLADMREITTLKRWNAQMITLKGSYLLMAVGQYTTRFDSLLTLDVTTGRMWVPYGPTTVPGVATEEINPLLASMDANGVTYIITTDGKDYTKDKLVKVYPPPVIPLATPKVEILGTVTPESVVTVVGQNLMDDKATTTVFINGTETPTTVVGDVLTFIAPVETGEYSITVKVTDSTQSVESDKMTLIVSSDSQYRVGVVTSVSSIYYEDDGISPGKIVRVIGSDLGLPYRTVIGGAVATQTSPNQTLEDGSSTSTVFVPAETTLGRQVIIVEKLDADGLLINRSQPFVVEVVKSAPTVFRLVDDSSYLIVSNETTGNLISGDNPASTGDKLIIYVTGRNDADLTVSIDDRPVDVVFSPSQTLAGVEEIRFTMPETIWYGSNVRINPPEKTLWFNTNPPAPSK